MLKVVNAMGDACPIPVVKTKNAIKELSGAGMVETLVDNEIARPESDKDGTAEELWRPFRKTGREPVQSDYDHRRISG